MATLHSINPVPKPEDAMTCRLPFGQYKGRRVASAVLSCDYEYIVWLRTMIFNDPGHSQRWLLPYLDALLGAAQRIPVVDSSEIRCTRCDGKPQFATITGTSSHGYSMTLDELYCHFDKDPKSIWRVSRNGSFCYTLPLKLDTLCLQPLVSRDHADDRQQFWNDILRPALGLPKRITPDTAWHFLAPHYQKFYDAAQKAAEEIAAAKAGMPPVLPPQPPATASSGQLALRI